MFGKADAKPADKADDSKDLEKLFGDSKEDKPAEPKNDDLFGKPAAGEEVKKDSAADDLFGAPKADAKPADDLFGAPPQKEDPAADLFGEPAKPAAQKEEDLFGAPVEEPKAAEQPKNAADDLFGAPAAEQPKPANNADDLFGTGNPVSTDAPQTNTEKAKPNSIDDLFSSQDRVFKGADFRVWIDNTGNFQTSARLATIYPDRIKLQKENGKFTTVSLRRLSDADKLYVQWVASSLTKQSKQKYVQANAETFENETN